MRLREDRVPRRQWRGHLECRGPRALVNLKLAALAIMHRVVRLREAGVKRDATHPRAGATGWELACLREGGSPRGVPLCSLLPHRARRWRGVMSLRRRSPKR